MSEPVVKSCRVGFLRPKSDFKKFFDQNYLFYLNKKIKGPAKQQIKAILVPTRLSIFQHIAKKATSNFKLDWSQAVTFRLLLPLCSSLLTTLRAESLSLVHNLPLRRLLSFQNQRLEITLREQFIRVPLTEGLQLCPSKFGCEESHLIREQGILLDLNPINL